MVSQTRIEFKKSMNFIDQVIDAAGRDYLLKCISKSRNKNDIGLYHFVRFEATYPQIVSIAFFKDFKILNEGPKNDRRLDAVRRSISPIVGMGFAVIAGGKTAEAAGQTFNIGVAATALGLGTHIALGFGATLLVYILFAIYKLTSDKCRKTCKDKVELNDDERRLKVSICISKCKIFETGKLIKELRSEIKKCNKTRNPEKCQTTLIKQVGHYNSALAKEQNRLRKKTEKLKDKLGEKRRKKPVSLTDKPPQIV